MLKSSWLMYVLLIWPSAYAASFDCARAKTAIEKAIRSDPHLSTLDDRVNLAYQSALKKAGEGDVLVRHEQRAWLNDLKDQCSSEQIGTCIEQQDNARIAKLNATPAFSPGSVTEYKLTQASRYFDFKIRMFAKPADAADEREGPGRLLVYSKGTATPLQTISMDNILVSLDKAGQPLTDAAKPFEYQGPMNVADLNFDGHEDMAIQNGNLGPYATPSYDVYLYSPAKNLFELSKPLTELAAGVIGLFQIDPSKKLLTTFTKADCCYHQTVSYALLNNIPLPVSREIEDSVKNQITTQHMVKGEWVGVTRPMPPDKTQ